MKEQTTAEKGPRSLTPQQQVPRTPFLRCVCSASVLTRFTNATTLCCLPASLSLPYCSPHHHAPVVSAHPKPGHWHLAILLSARYCCRRIRLPNSRGFHAITTNSRIIGSVGLVIVGLTLAFEDARGIRKGAYNGGNTNDDFARYLNDCRWLILIAMERRFPVVWRRLVGEPSPQIAGARADAQA